MFGRKGEEAEDARVFKPEVEKHKRSFSALVWTHLAWYIAAGYPGTP
jgi:hypothetical protein